MPEQGRPAMFIQSIIDSPRWDKAKWRGAAFLTEPSGNELPALGFIFEKGQVGRQIFEDWQKRVGSVDRFEELRVSIIEWDIAGEDTGYSVHISSDPLHTQQRAKNEGIDLQIDYIAIMGRVNRMTAPPGSPHLALFKQAYQKHQKYLLVPVSMDTRGAHQPPSFQPQLDLTIEKREIHFRLASEITKDDLDAVVLT